MQVVAAQPKDFAAWLRLAAEVESLFGAPLANSPDFHRALHKNTGRGTAFCVREGDGPPGTPLLGGLLFSPKPPLYTIGWLAVAERSRRHGVGRRLVEHILALVKPPAEVIVTTFGAGVEGGQAARQFYESMGFHSAEPATDGPDGQPRQVYRLRC